MRKVMLMCVLLAGASAALFAQTAESVEGRLLQVLRNRGVIDAAEFAELSTLEKQLRESGNLEAQVNSTVEGLVARMQDGAPKTAWKPGKGFAFTSADGNNSMVLGGRVQVRATLDNFEDADNKINFAAQRVRLWAEGHVFSPEWKYHLQFDVAGDRVTAGSSTSSASYTALRSAWIDHAVANGVNLRLGQFKTPYSRQFLTSSGSQEFVDRWQGLGQFTQNYQPGFMVHGAAGGEKSDLVEYQLGVFNGNGINVQQTSGGDDMVLLAGRVAINPFGAISMSEGDFKAGDFKASLGLNGWSAKNTTLDATDQSVGVDLTVAGHGFYATGEYHDRSFADGTPDRTGYFVQAGYFVDPGTMDIGVRYGRYEGGSSTLDNSTELLGVVGWYLDHHNVKVQLDAGQVSVNNFGGTGDTDDFRVRLQAQIIF